MVVRGHFLGSENGQTGESGNRNEPATFHSSLSLARLVAKRKRSGRRCCFGQGVERRAQISETNENKPRHRESECCNGAILCGGVPLLAEARVSSRFGGPTGQIAIMHTELVEKKALDQRVAFSARARTSACCCRARKRSSSPSISGGCCIGRGAALSPGALFVIPSMFILWGLSYIYVAYGNVPWIAAIFYGLKPAVLAIVAAAVIRIGRKALKNQVMWLIAALAFVGDFFSRGAVSR